MSTASLVCGLVGTGLFVVVFLVDGATRPGYRPTYHPVSALSLGPRGWVQTANFCVSGLLITAAAPGIRAASDSTWLAAAIAVFGLALLASGVFPMDPMRGYPPGTPDGTPPTTSRRHDLHDHAGALVFTSLPLAAVIAAVVLDDLPWRVYAGVTAAVFGGLFLWFGSAWEADDPRAGLAQRLAIVVGWTWLGLLCGRLLSQVS